VTGAMHLLGLGGRQVNRYKAYDCFCRAHSTGLAAATHNRAVCKWMGYGCRQDEEEAVTRLKGAAESTSLARLMALVLSFSHCYAEATGNKLRLDRLPQVQLSAIPSAENKYLDRALSLDTAFPPALCQHLLKSTQEPDPEHVRVLNAAFMRGFSFAGYV
jgi:hypothetical protein